MPRATTTSAERHAEPCATFAPASTRLTISSTFANNLPGFDSEQSGVWQNAGIAYTHIFSPTLLNELRISYGRMGLSFLPRPDNVPADSMATISIAAFRGGARVN